MADIKDFQKPVSLLTSLGLTSYPTVTEFKHVSSDVFEGLSSENLRKPVQVWVYFYDCSRYLR